MRLSLPPSVPWAAPVHGYAQSFTRSAELVGNSSVHLSGQLFGFFATNWGRVKLLYWDRTGGSSFTASRMATVVFPPPRPRACEIRRRRLADALDVSIWTASTQKALSPAGYRLKNPFCNLRTP